MSFVVFVLLVVNIWTEYHMGFCKLRCSLMSEQENHHDEDLVLRDPGK
jgi:hypothetical protein